MRTILKSSLLVASLVFASVAAACGGAAAPPVAPGETTATPTAPTAPTDVPTASAVPTTTPSATPTAPPASTVQNQTIQASAMLDDVKKAGVNLAKPVKLEALPIGTKKKVMPLMMKALGYADCKGCHVEGDFKKETRNMKVARQMWDHFVVAERDQKGGPVFCDSCHNGKQKLLDRSNKDAVKKLMESDYVGKLTQASKKDQECATCHTDTFEMKIIEKVWAIPPG